MSYKNPAFAATGFAIALIPLGVIVVAAILWLCVGVFWLGSLVVNIVTILIGGFIIIPIEWIFLLSEWILSWLGPFIGGYFSKDNFFSWLNNIYLVGFLTLGGYIIDIFVDDELYSDSKETSSLSSKNQRERGQSHFSTGKNQRRARIKPTNNPQGLETMGLLDAMKGGMQLQAYLPNDVIAGLEKSNKYFIGIMSQIKTPQGQRKFQLMSQLQMNFEVYQRIWNEEKNKEALTVMETASSRIDSSQPRITNTEQIKTQELHLLMLKQLKLMEDVYNGKNINLELPSLPWFEVEPIVSKFTQGKISKVILRDEIRDVFYNVIQSGKIDIRYHNIIDDIHNGNINQVLSPEFGVEGIPLAIAAVEFIDHNIWFNLRTIGRLNVIENNGSKILKNTNPEAILIHEAAMVGKRTNMLNQEDMTKIIDTLVKFAVNPLEIQLKVHIDVGMIENYLRQN